MYISLCTAEGEGVSIDCLHVLDTSAYNSVSLCTFILECNSALSQTSGSKLINNTGLNVL